MKALRQAPATFPDDTVWPAMLEVGPTPEAWAQRRETLLRQWLKILGPFPEPCELSTEVVSDEDAGSHRRLKMRYQVEPGIWVDAYLLLPPPRDEPRPAVVVLHPTCPDTIDEAAGLTGRASRFNGLHLVEQGYVVLCPKNYLFHYRDEEVKEREGAFEKFGRITARMLDEHPGWTGMGKMIWDASRAVDVLVARPEVDAGRIGCFGMSLGAKEALYLPAFDDRVKSSVSIDGGIGLPYSNWEAPWYLGDQITRDRFGHDNHEVLALIAPRAFCLMGSTGGIDEETGEWVEGYDGERSWPYIAAAQPVWNLLGAGERLGNLCHDHGHSVPRVALDLTMAWFAQTC